MSTDWVNADWTYLAAPLLAWLAAGSLKFALNSWRMRALAFSQIGLGNFPSNHSTIVSTVAALIGLREGLGPVFGVALALGFIVILDALDLRRKLARHAAAINALRPASGGEPLLREKLGHTPAEVAGGIALGIGLGALLAQF